MSVVTITDGSGRHFDTAKAQEWEEDSYWDGRNVISRATGSQWDHEALYLTSSGRWVLHTWSQWQGKTEHWDLIDEGTAATWLSNNRYYDHPVVAAHASQLEL